MSVGSNESQRTSSTHTVSTRAVELAVAGAFMAAAAVVVWDSLRLGASWGADGPQSGYFPFYVGLIMFCSAVATVVQQLRTRPAEDSTFVERASLRRVLEVLIPSIVFVVLVGWLGIYLSSCLFIAYFMTRLGHYPVKVTLPVSILVPVALFVMFEIWFLVPLPKGPLETWLGY